MLRLPSIRLAWAWPEPLNAVMRTKYDWEKKNTLRWGTSACRTGALVNRALIKNFFDEF